MLRAFVVTGLVLSSSVIACAEEPVTWAWRDFSGNGTYAHVATFLVPPSVALEAYGSHPWSKEGTQDLYDLSVNPARRIGFGDRYEAFLRAHYPANASTTLGATMASVGHASRHSVQVPHTSSSTGVA